MINTFIDKTTKRKYFWWFLNTFDKMKYYMQKRAFLSFVIIAFLFWLLPFILRIFFIEIPEIHVLESKIQDANTTKNVIEEVVQLLTQHNQKDAFILIFKNNLKGCIINILGGVTLGVGTLMNMLINGFFSADIFINSYKMGLSVPDILKVTLPHSFELIGFWLSGGMGFYFTWNIIQFMRGKESFSPHFIRQMGICALIVFFIMLSAAYVESYISASISIK